MRMRELEPPRGNPHGDLNAARLPIPPHPRARTLYPVCRPELQAHMRSKRLDARSGSGPCATLSDALAPLSSRGLGRRPLTAETGVRIPVAVLHEASAQPGLFSLRSVSTVAAIAPATNAAAGTR